MTIADADVNNCEDPSKCWLIRPVALATESTVLNQRSVLRSLGWGAYDGTCKQSQYLRQVDLRFHSAAAVSCSCPEYYELRTKVGEIGQDAYLGDTGEHFESDDYDNCLVLLLHKQIHCIYRRSTHY